MKTFTVTGESLTFRAVFSAPPEWGTPVTGAPPIVREVVVEGEDAEVSDGWHTLSEVYDHRMAIFAALLTTLQKLQPMVDVWKSLHHSDCVPPPLYPLEGGPLPRGEGPCCSMFKGHFVCGIGTKPGEQITYHLPLEMFEDLKVMELEKAPEWDGHTAKQVLERLKRL